MSTWVILENLKKNCETKKTFIVPADWLRKLVTKTINMFLRFGMNLKWNILDLYLKCDVVLLADVFGKI